MNEARQRIIRAQTRAMRREWFTQEAQKWIDDTEDKALTVVDSLGNVIRVPAPYSEPLRLLREALELLDG